MARFYDPTIWTRERAYPIPPGLLNKLDRAAASGLQVRSLRGEYRCKADGSDDASRIQAAFTEAIADGSGLIFGEPGAYRINSSLDLVGMRSTGKGAQFLGAGAGAVGSSNGTTTIQNYSGGPAIKAYGAAVIGVSESPISSVVIKDLVIANYANLGTNYTLDFDYVTEHLILQNVHILGRGFTGNGVRFLNFGYGQSVLEVVSVWLGSGNAGTGFYLGSEATANVTPSGTQSGPMALIACMSDGFKGYVTTGDCNGVAFIATKAVGYSAVSSIGYWATAGSRGNSYFSTHAEGYDQSYQLESTSYGHNFLTALASAGAISANTTGFRIKSYNNRINGIAGGISPGNTMVNGVWFDGAAALDNEALVTPGLAQAPTTLILDQGRNNQVNNRRENARTAAPSGGTWQLGDVVWNSTPASAGFVGWVCTVAGTPGTWKTFGLIS